MQKVVEFAKKYWYITLVVVAGVAYVVYKQMSPKTTKR